MMAASARTSGTSWPSSSILKRGVVSSRMAFACAAARACARRAARDFLLDAYDFFLSVFFGAGFLAEVFFCALTDGRVDFPRC